MRFTTRHSRSGFTLIELIIVMALLTIAVGLAAPRLASFFRGRALDSEARRLLSIARYAQDRASSDGSPVKLWIDSRKNSFGILADADASQKVEAVELEFPVDPNLQLVVEASAPSRATARPTVSAPRKNASGSETYDELPGMRFLPDGTIEEGSIERITLRDGEGYAVVLARSQNRLSYEILK